MERLELLWSHFMIEFIMLIRNLVSTLLILPCIALGAPAAGWETPESIQAVAESFVRQKTANIEGQVNISSTPPDNRVKVPKCNAMEATLPQSNRLWGRSAVKISCPGPTRWTLYVPVMVQVTGKALVTTRAMGSGQIIDPQDVELQEMELSAYPAGVFTRPEQVAGKTTAVSIPSGSPIRAEQLRAPLAIRQGQQVVVVANGANFKVSSEGVAMGNAQPGQVVAVKTKSGQVVKGIARGDGVVEVSF